MSDCYLDKLKIKDVNKVGFALTDFDLLHKRFKKNIDRNADVFLEDYCKIPQHELPHGQFFMVFDKEEGQFFVDNRGIGVFVLCKLI